MISWLSGQNPSRKGMSQCLANVGWRLQGGGYDDSVIETTISLLQRDDLHYEDILGGLTDDLSAN
jgi:hypothetical protein